MSILASELARMAGPKCQGIVAATMQRWEDKIRERVRLEMALKLADESGWGRQVQRVGVVLSDGLPTALVPYEDDLTKKLAEIAGMFRPDLQSFSEGASALQQLLDRLGDLDRSWADRAAVADVNVSPLLKLVEELLSLAAQATFTETLRKINQDILGAYFPVGKKAKSNGPPVIEVYWAVLGAVAKTIDVDVEGLTLVVLTHELAHAYSHLGADTDGNRWSDKAFCDSDVFIKEGIAQYYTDRIMHWLEQRNVGRPFYAFTELLKIQGSPYQIHQEWSREFSPEGVRAAIIECRNSQITAADAFIGLMEMAKQRLTRRS